MKAATRLIPMVIAIASTCFVCSVAQAQNAESEVPLVFRSEKAAKKTPGCYFMCKDPNRPPGKPCIVPPHATFDPDPEYSEQARRIGKQGTVLLDFIVGKKGEISDIKVARSLDPGLDQSSIDTLKTWKFEPATLEGNPVPVRLRVMMNFRCYPGPPHAAPPVIKRKP